jgi:hypothetical protein
MAEKIVSPGVFTQENDLSFLPQGISILNKFLERVHLYHMFHIL